MDTMGLSVWRIILIIAVIVFVVAAVVCHIIAVATDYWLQSSAPERNNFLRIGLWRACFDRYTHPHEENDKHEHPVYDGCHNLYSDEYESIRDWLVPGKVSVQFFSCLLALSCCERRKF